MQKITLAAAEQLAQTASYPCITLYLPTHPTASPPHIRQSQTYYKNLCTAAVHGVKDESHATKLAVEQTRERLDHLHDDLEFWSNQAEGLVVCASPESINSYNLPLPCDPYASLDHVFHLAPLLGLQPILTNYYVLAISQKAPALFAGDAYEVQRQDIKLPGSVASELGIDEMVQERESSQFHSITGGAGAEWHGHGGAKDAGDQERLTFFRLVDDQVRKHTDTSRPLLLAGTESEVAEYRQLSRHPHLLDGYIPGSHHATSLTGLLAHAQIVIQKEIVDKAHRTVLDRYQDAQELASAELATIERAAQTGRIDTLLLGLLRNTADNVQDTLSQQLKITLPEPPAMPHLNAIALQTCRQGGSVILLEETNMPAHSQLAAIFRY